MGHLCIYIQARENSNLIHSGSSCNVRAAQQVVLWCLSLVLKCCDFFWVLWRKKTKQKKHNLENTSLSLIIKWPSSQTLACTYECVCYMQALGWCASEVLQKGRRHLEKRAASSISLYSEARKPEWQRNQGQLESGSRARTGEGESQGSLRSGLES